MWQIEMVRVNEVLIWPQRETPNRVYKESWWRNHGGGIKEEKSLWRNHDVEASKRHLGGIWEHPGSFWDASWKHLVALDGLGALGATEASSLS